MGLVVGGYDLSVLRYNTVGDGDWRNWLARWYREPEVAGSNPVSPTLYRPL